LNLAHIAFPHPLHFKDCVFDSLADLCRAALKELSFAGCHAQLVELDGAEITGSVFAAGLEADGKVYATGVHIGGQLGLRGAKLRNADGSALSLDGAEITGGMFAGDLEANGAVRAPGAKIGGPLGLQGAKLRNADGSALSLDRAEITGGMFAEGLEADGEVRAPEARFGGLGLSEARLRNADGSALSLDRAEITGGVLAQGLEADGEVRAISVHIGGQLGLSGAKLRNADGDGLNLESASIKRLMLGPADLADPLGPVDITGKVRLYRAAITDLDTDANPPSPLVATGWEVTDIHGPLRSDWAAARRWLETTPEKSAQPWHALAAVYERNGEPAGARRLRFAAANKVTSQSPLPTKILRTLYGAVVGYGYYPLLAGFWLAMVVVAGSIIVAANRADFVPNRYAANSVGIAHAQPTHNPNPAPITAQTPCSLYPNYPCLNSFTYTLSALTPTFGATTSDWAMRSDATNWLTIALPLLKLTAWALTALLLAGVTGLLRKT
jgi:uncharacterized protein YjbI with pentapeptide repeats